MPEAADFTIRETAALAGVGKTAVDKAIETEVVRARKGKARLKGGTTRYLPISAIVYFTAIERSGLGPTLAVKYKRRIFSEIAKGGPTLAAIEFAPGAKLDVKKLAADRFRAARRYRIARDKHIVANEEILGGTPVIKGTRMSVYSVLARIQAGESLDALHRDNPDIPLEALEAAEIYARAHPLRGKPGGRPWRNAA
ncbi:MAG: DUF433 domain-containing protein [Amphiplicatus sp.]